MVRATCSVLLACLAMLAGAVPAAAAPAQDLIHSDLPLWTDQADVMWPKHIADPGEIGCVNRLQMGDWRMGATGDDPDDRLWLRLTNYGVFHCFIVERHAYEQKGLAGADVRHSFLIELGPARSPKGQVELWALQSGARPGSDYMLLARAKSDGLIARFDVLEQACPKANVRHSKSLDTLLTDYCAINTQSGLRALAVRMAARPPLGILEFVAPAPDDEDDP